MLQSLSLGWAGLVARLPKAWAPHLFGLLRPLHPLCFWSAQAGQRPMLANSDQTQQPEDACTWGCGWFDSSHELVHGLQVEEYATEALNALPLATWLDWELRLCSPSVPSA